uniref:52 kDa repressor of the inhibitor of the protein kinase-like n=1 Tax=Ciona intestinalis TaxID=7719 RepID=UPI0002B8EE97
MSCVKAECFEANWVSTTGPSVVSQMNSRRKEEAIKNRSMLSSMVDAIKFCGRQSISLRGKVDHGPLTTPNDFEAGHNEGNFRALLRYSIQSGNGILLDHVRNCPRNAAYMSSTIQNEIIATCGEIIRSSLVKKINSSGFFSILADETTDVSCHEQFSLCARYVDESGTGELVVREDFLGYVAVEDLTGSSLAEVILHTLQRYNIDCAKLRGQGYDGASNMAGKFSGVQTKIRELHPLAAYTHCSSHVLNLVLGKSTQLRPIRRAVRQLSNVINFFNSSPKRQLYLGRAIEAFVPQSRRSKLRTLCETRWVERHDAVILFVEMLSPVVHALGELETCGVTGLQDKAEEFRFSIRNIEFLVSLKTLESVLAVTLSLSRSLQTENCDIVGCFQMVSDVSGVFESMVTNSVNEFHTLYECCLSLAANL